MYVESESERNEEEKTVNTAEDVFGARLRAACEGPSAEELLLSRITELLSRFRNISIAELDNVLEETRKKLFEHIKNIVLCVQTFP